MGFESETDDKHRHEAVRTLYLSSVSGSKSDETFRRCVCM